MYVNDSVHMFVMDGHCLWRLGTVFTAVFGAFTLVPTLALVTSTSTTYTRTASFLTVCGTLAVSRFTRTDSWGEGGKVHFKEYTYIVTTRGKGEGEGGIASDSTCTYCMWYTCSIHLTLGTGTCLHKDTGTHHSLGIHTRNSYQRMTLHICNLLHTCS